MSYASIDAYRPQIEAALAQPAGAPTHTFEDVRSAVARDEMQFWPGPRGSLLITQVLDWPQFKEVHCFLGAGNLKEVQQLTEIVLEWARGQGCTRASLIGRRGWMRSFLTRTGWTQCDWIRMEKTL